MGLEIKKSVLEQLHPYPVFWAFKSIFLISKMSYLFFLKSPPINMEIGKMEDQRPSSLK